MGPILSDIKDNPTPTLFPTGVWPEKVKVLGAPSIFTHCFLYKRPREILSFDPAYAGFTTFKLYIYCV